MNDQLPDIEADLAAMPADFRKFLDNLVDATLQAAREVGMSRLDAMLVLIHVGRRAQAGIQSLPSPRPTKFQK